MAKRRTPQHQYSPGPVGRLIAVFVGCWYIFFISLVFSQALDVPFIFALAGVVAGAILQMLIIGELSRRLARRQRGQQRFGLGTLILLMTGCSIYLAAYGGLLRAGLVDADRVPVLAAVILAAGCILFVLISTMVLTYCAEALVWAGIAILTAWRLR